jgi:hypothetical protein
VRAAWREQAAEALCCAHVPRNGLRPFLLLYFAPQSAPPSCSAGSDGVRTTHAERVVAKTVLGWPPE